MKKQKIPTEEQRRQLKLSGRDWRAFEVVKDLKLSMIVRNVQTQVMEVIFKK